ncbi:MAG: O-antigen ligase family protein [Gammaproteobacteria bacterium]|nr:O-antigen ligase family protein [Gammaproteobacteria bacterium]
MHREIGQSVLSGLPERRRPSLGVVYRGAVWLYVVAVVLLSFQQGLTAYAKGAGVVIICLFFFYAVSHGSRVSFLREYKVLLAWFLFAVVSSFLSGSPEAALPKIITLIQVFVVGFVITNFIIWNGSSTFYWAAIVLAALVSGAITLADPVSFSSIDGRIYGTLDNPNNFAAMMAMCVGLCLAVALGKGATLLRILSGALVLVFFYLVVRSGSRTGMIASVAGVSILMTCWYASEKRKWVGRRMAVGVVALAIVAGTGAYLASSEFSARLFRLVTLLESGDLDSTKETSLSNRVWMLRRAMRIAVDNPILGAGLDAFKTEQYTAGRQVGFNSHSNYVEIAASTGFVGAFIYFSMYYIWIAQLWRIRRILAEEKMAAKYARIVACVALLTILDLGQVTYYHKIPWLLMAGFIADLHLLNVRIGRTFGAVVNRPRRYIG